MINEVARIGEAVVAGRPDRLLEAVVEPIESLVRRAKGDPVLVRVELQSRPPSLRLEPLALDPNQAAEYAWIGNVRGTRPQTRVTTSTLAYLLGQTPAALHDEARTPPEVAELLERIFPELFHVEESLKGSERRYAYLLHAERLGWLTQEEWQAILSKKPKDRAKALAERLLEKAGLRPHAVLFTLVVDGVPLAKLPAYRRFLVEGLVEEAFEQSAQGVCHLCQSPGETTADFTRFKLLKFYINDKLNFAYGLTERRWGQSFAVCKRCYVNLLAGERQLEKAFETRVLETTALLIPHLGAGQAQRWDLGELAEVFTKAATGLDRLEHVPYLLEKLKTATDLPQLTLLFVKKSNSAVKVQEVVPEVKPSRMAELLKAIGEANELADRLFGPPLKGYWVPGLSTLLRLLPLRSPRRELDTAPALRAFRQILLQEPMPRARWVQGFLAILRHAHRQNPGLYATRKCRGKKQGCPELHDLIPSMAAFLAFLERAGVIEEVNGVSAKTRNYPEAIETLGLDEAKAALFLLGVLLARVGRAQFHKGKTKPVLEKLGFQGMPLAKVKRFALELFEKLGEYRLRDAGSEAVFGEAMELLAKNEQAWPLSDEENAFYILLGYGYETRRAFPAGEAGGDGE